MAKTNNSSISANKDSNLPKVHTKKACTNSSDSPGFKPAAVWEAPSFEEIGLCMEVTAYVHQWD
ncbi:MAG: pyrroloquinoline quinone precursor peptide PqqA [Cyanobacteriota bacterium]|nr:pyrroloquinoline quinone precursor peptide PqqA [Cyanobacteriota bacterium]